MFSVEVLKRDSETPHGSLERLGELFCVLSVPFDCLYFILLVETVFFCYTDIYTLRLYGLFLDFEHGR